MVQKLPIMCEVKRSDNVIQFCENISNEKRARNPFFPRILFRKFYRGRRTGDARDVKTATRE